MPGLIEMAVEEVKNLRERSTGFPKAGWIFRNYQLPDPPLAGKGPLSPEAVAVTVNTIQAAAKAETLAEALEIGYQGFGEIACTEAAREGISAFLEKRKPEFKK